MKKENFVIPGIGLILAVAAWIWPDAHLGVKVVAAVTLSVLFLLSSQRDIFKDIRAHVNQLSMLVLAYYPLMLSCVASGISIYVLSQVDETQTSSLITTAQFILTALLAASLSSLVILSRSPRPSLRIVKISDGTTYLLENRVRRRIPDQLTLTFLLLDTYQRIEQVSEVELGMYREGEQLAAIASCKLVKSTLDPSTYVIWMGKRKWIPDPETLQYFFPNVYGDPSRIEQLETRELEKIPRIADLPSISAWLRFWGDPTIQ